MLVRPGRRWSANRATWHVLVLWHPSDVFDVLVGNEPAASRPLVAFGHRGKKPLSSPKYVI